MIVTVFGATGRVGKYIVRMALAKGYNVKAFGRNIESLIDADFNNDKLETIKGFVFDKTDVLKAVSGSDVIFSALGGGIDGSDKTRSLGIKNITEQMLKAGVKRILAVGGMGSLKDDEYEYRFNKRNMRKWLFNDVLVRLMNQIPHPYNYLKTLRAYST